MAISWDFTAAAKAQAAGRAAAAKETANAINSVSSSMRLQETKRRNQQLEKERQDRAAQAQQLVVDKFNRETENTFKIPAGADGKDYSNVNQIFDYSANQLVKTYTSIYNDKDMDSDKRAMALKKLTNQIPLLKNAQATLNTNIASFAEGALTGNISKAMEPQWQEMYEELADGKFGGGIDYVDGETRLIGKTSSGYDINLPLRDFQKNLPGIQESAGNITDVLDVTRNTYKTKYKAYLDNPLKNPLPVFDLKQETNDISKSIGELGENGYKRYGMDVLKYTEEELDEKIHKYMTGEVSRPSMPGKTLGSLTKEQQIRFGNDNAKMTEAEAMLYATDDLAAEMAQIQKTYLDQTRFLKPIESRPDALFIQQTDQGYQNKEGGFNIDDITIEDDKYAPNVKDFKEENEVITIIKGGAESNEGTPFPDKTIKIDLTNSDDVLEYITGPDYMRYAKGQKQQQLANKKAIIKANEIAKENIAKRKKRIKDARDAKLKQIKTTNTSTGMLGIVPPVNLP